MCKMCRKMRLRKDSRMRQQCWWGGGIKRSRKTGVVMWAIQKSSHNGAGSVAVGNGKTHDSGNRGGDSKQWGKWMGQVKEEATESWVISAVARWPAKQNKSPHAPQRRYYKISLYIYVYICKYVNMCVPKTTLFSYPEETARIGGTRRESVAMNVSKNMHNF